MSTTTNPPLPSTRSARSRGMSRRRRRDGRVVFYRDFPRQTPAEERANQVTHALAALASLAGGGRLIQMAAQHGDLAMSLGCVAYVVSLLAVFLMSTLSHSFAAPRLRHRFRALDQASIYLLIAGTCTPYFLRFLAPQGWGWMLALIWGVALVGAWSKVRGWRTNSISVGLYLAAGWLPVVAARPLIESMPLECLLIVIASGLAYTTGVVFLVLDERRRFFHAIWHLLVIIASGGFYAGISWFVVG
ncbi:MAG: hemolysin III family protein [Planctomycetales bacterium]